MTANLFARLSSIAKPSAVTEIVRLLGAPEQTVSRGLALSTAAAFAGLARKADDSDTLRRVIDVASRTRGDAVASIVSAGALTDPRSPLSSEGVIAFWRRCSGRRSDLDREHDRSRIGIDVDRGGGAATSGRD